MSQDVNMLKYRGQSPKDKFRAKFRRNTCNSVGGGNYSLNQVKDCSMMRGTRQTAGLLGITRFDKV